MLYERATASPSNYENIHRTYARFVFNNFIRFLSCIKNSLTFWKYVDLRYTFFNNYRFLARWIIRIWMYRVVGVLFFRLVSMYLQRLYSDSISNT